MSRTSLVKGGKIVAGKSNGKKNGAGTFIPYDKAKKEYDNSQSVRLGTSGVQDTAKSLVNTYQSNNPNVRKSEMGTSLISSQQGKNLVTDADQTMNNLAPFSALPTTPVSEGGQTGTTTPTTGTDTQTKPADNTNDYVTYVNESTGQEMTLKGPALTEEAKADALKKGYTEASSEISGVKTTPEMAKLQREVDSATRETDTFMSRLESMLITDKELKGEISQISAKYKARQNEMRDINERRQVAMETLGVRTGARYTGGSGGIMGGILSEEERQGLMRIESIENDKQDAIMNAKKAARDQNFSLYTQLAAKAEKMQEKKATELQALKKAQAEQDAKIAEEKQQTEYDALIAEQLGTGNTDPTKLFQALGGKVPYDKILEVAKLLPKAPEDFTLSEGQARYDANGKLLASRAKTYAPTGAGSIDIPGSGILSDFPADIQNAAQSILDGKSKLNEYPSAKRLAINSAMSLIYKAEGGDQLAQDSYDAIVALETHPGFSDAIGAKGMASFYGLKDQPVGGSDAAGFIAKLNQFKANVKLVNIKYLKGTGALSDAEGKTLEDAGTSLDPSLPETDFADELERVKKVLEKTSNIKIDYSNESNADLEAAIDAEIGGETDDVESDGLDANGYPL